jgi:hypothetical protein
MSYHFIFQHGSHISLFPILASIAIFYMNWHWINKWLLLHRKGYGQKWWKSWFMFRH